MKLMVSKRDVDDCELEIINEWQQVAAVMDRMLFWLFLVTTIVATFVMMLLIPIIQAYSSKPDDWNLFPNGPV